MPCLLPDSWTHRAPGQAGLMFLEMPFPRKAGGCAVRGVGAVSREARDISPELVAEPPPQWEVPTAGRACQPPARSRSRFGEHSFPIPALRGHLHPHTAECVSQSQESTGHAAGRGPRSGRRRSRCGRPPGGWPQPSKHGPLPAPPGPGPCVPTPALGPSGAANQDPPGCAALQCHAKGRARLQQSHSTRRSRSEAERFFFTPGLPDMVAALPVTACPWGPQ